MTSSTWGLIGTLVVMAVVLPAIKRAYRRSPSVDETGRAEIRYSHWYTVLTLAAFPITVLCLFMAYILRSSIGAFLLCSLMGFVFGVMTLALLRRATTMLVATDEGLVQRVFGKSVSIKWSDAFIDAVERVDGTVVIRGSGGQEVVVSEHMVGANVLETLIARHVPRERVRLASSLPGVPAHFFRPYDRPRG